ncbi:conserved oligomeric Golgi complex subunit 1-like isoform X2 [Babylonia areolata]|uniref:conserved oligomeric Golgi complex subunit 1-like isoform X2 n=1 Tax=Babylonia areolata TaxID=304850 RepID=UPI003FCFA745
MANMAPEKGAVGPPSSVEIMDTGELFEKLTIEEIRDKEKKIRAEIEKKKEDLRVMVGERYRDLIEAADTITAMKNSAENVMKSISNMEELCQTLQHKQMVKEVAFQNTAKPDQSKKRKETEFFGVAAQIKLLLDMPEKIWSSVDSGDYLTGTQLYLLARHINTSLHLDSQRSSKVLSWFPVLTRQWAAISHFKTTILQECRSLLADTETAFSDQKMAEILCSILLMDDSNPRQVFSEFLLARTKALQQMLHGGQQSNVKDQVCGVVRLLTSTIHLIHAVFYDPGQAAENSDNCNLLLKTLYSVVNYATLSKVFGLEDTQGPLSAKYLPKSVKEFHPSLRTALAAIAVDVLQGNCQQWINTCLQDVRSGVGKLLNYINSVKRMADIRDAVWIILAKTGDTAGWQEVCIKVMSKPVQVWQEFLQSLFLDRVKALIQYQLDSTAEMTKRSISKIMMELASDVKDSSMVYEVDLGQFLWSEAVGDVQMSSVWQPATSRPTVESGGLVFKARAFTPAVLSLCHSMEGKLKTLLEDSESYLQFSMELVMTQTAENSPFDRFASTADILLFCQVASSKALVEIVDYMTEQLTLWEKSLKDIPDPDTQASTENKILMVARMCSALSELTPHLQKCVLGIADYHRQESPGRKSRSQQKAHECPEWQSIVNKLDQCRTKSHRVWVEHTVASITTDFVRAVSGTEHNNIIEKATRWEEAEIMEETEEGKKLSSKIQVPMQASWFVNSALFQLCQKFNKVGAHAFPRWVVKDVLVRVLQGMLAAYETLLATRKKGSKNCTPLSQQEALQAVFNVKYILHMIPWREDSQASKACQRRCQMVVEGLEEHVDPFDLDVFSPYIQTNLMKATQRSAVLLGALSVSDRHAMLTSGRPAMGSQEQHNVLALTSCSARFPLLPIGSKPSRSSFQQTVLSQTISRALDGGAVSSLTSVVEATLPKNSSQSDLSSSFYDKLDRLGSMGSRLFSNIGGKS